MLGNLGYSSVNCDSVPMNVGYVGLQCNYGLIGEIVDFGLHERNEDDTYEMCVNEDYMHPCKPDSQSLLTNFEKAKGQEMYHFDIHTNRDFYLNPAAHPDRCFQH